MQLKLNLSRNLAQTFEEPEGREFAPMVYCYIMDVGVPFGVRRARLLMGMTQAEFAELFEVDDGSFQALQHLQPFQLRQPLCLPLWGSQRDSYKTCRECRFVAN